MVMIIFWIILAIGAAYFFTMFVLLRFLAPFMGFKQYQSKIQVTPEIRNTISELENKFGGQKVYLQAVYNLVLDKTLYQWKHTRFKAAVRLRRLFLKDLKEIWNTQDFVYCNGINFVTYALLVNSKFFTTKDVKVRHVFLNFVLHQYLQVKVGSEWVDVDPAGAGIRGFGLGHHASFFG